MRKNTGSDERVGLLEREESAHSYRPETTDIPDPVLEETANPEDSGPFLRAKQRVPVRRRGASKFAWKSRWVRLVAGVSVIAALGLLTAIVWETEFLLRHNSHFILASAQDIQVAGNRVVSSHRASAFFAPDIGHSVFSVPLEKRQAELEQINWVRTATVMRLWPNRLRVALVERTPVAFARDGNTVRLVDDDGALLDLPNAVAQHYSFPVVSGISAGDPVSTRAARMQQYEQFMHALDADGGHVAATLSEVDLSDPEDVRATFDGGAHDPLVHFGDKDFLPRYRAYQTHLTEWLQQYPQLRSVDMRYGKQVVLDMGTPAATATPIQNVNAGAGNVARESHVNTVAHPNASASKTEKKTRAVAHHAVPRKHERQHKHDPQRGHIVRDPIMQTVAGG